MVCIYSGGLSGSCPIATRSGGMNVFSSRHCGAFHHPKRCGLPQRFQRADKTPAAATAAVGAGTSTAAVFRTIIAFSAGKLSGNGQQFFGIIVCVGYRHGKAACPFRHGRFVSGMQRNLGAVCAYEVRRSLRIAKTAAYVMNISARQFPVIVSVFWHGFVPSRIFIAP